MVAATWLAGVKECGAPVVLLAFLAGEAGCVDNATQALATSSVAVANGHRVYVTVAFARPAALLLLQRVGVAEVTVSAAKAIR